MTKKLFKSINKKKCINNELTYLNNLYIYTYVHKFDFHFY